MTVRQCLQDRIGDRTYTQLKRRAVLDELGHMLADA
jgi:hypothetical protein